MLTIGINYSQMQDSSPCIVGSGDLPYRMIDKFGKITAVPVIMNTSCNLRGEKFLHTPIGALRMSFGSGMAALVIGSFLFEK